MLVELITIPRSAEEWERWSWAHRSSHTAIRQKIAANGGPNLTEYAALYPISHDRFGDFLTANSQTHIEMDAVIGAQNVDLQDVDPKDENQLIAWIQLHYLEHQTAELALGI